MFVTETNAYATCKMHNRIYYTIKHLHGIFYIFIVRKMWQIEGTITGSDTKDLKTKVLKSFVFSQSEMFYDSN